MKSLATFPDPLVKATPASPVVFVIDSNGSLHRAFDIVPHDDPWRIEAVASFRALLELRPASVPCCLVLEVSTPDCELPPLPWPTDIPVICITEFADISLCVRAMKAGAFDVLTKPSGGPALLHAVRLALKCSERRLRQEAELTRMRQRYASLSPREREVMALVASGRMNKRVADDLGISVITVKAHRGRVMRKMEAKSLADLVVMAVTLQLTAPEQTERSTPALRSALPRSGGEHHAQRHSCSSWPSANPPEPPSARGRDRSARPRVRGSCS